jgi:hypothetical protein
VSKSKFDSFMEELNNLQEKYNIYIHAEYEEELDYGWDEELYISGVNSYLAYYDSNGMPIATDEVYQRCTSTK